MRGRRARTMLSLAVLAAAAALDARADTPGAVAFPGQYALPPADARFPPYPIGCRRYSGDERAACLQAITDDFGWRKRYAAANAALAPRREGETRVVFLGDSITDQWSRAGSGGFFPGRRYVNRGIDGQTTGQMLLRFRRDVLALDPQAVVVLAGTNDVAGNTGPVPLEEIEGNLATMAELAAAHGVRVVLASLLPVSDDEKDARGGRIVQTKDRPPAALRALNAWIAEYARAHGHVYLDYFTPLANEAGALRPELTEDGLHPNAAGYAVMAPLAEQAIARALAR